MSLSPLNRPAGSNQILRYRGTITQGDTAGTYPKDPAEYPSNSGVSGGNFTAWVRFPLANFVGTSVDFNNPQKRLPPLVYDDAQPAEDVPSSVVLATASATPGINATDRTMNTFTWAQNLRIHYSQIDANVVFCDSGVSVDNNPANGAVILLDSGASSGLGDDTGLPVVAVRFVVAANDGSLQDFDVDIAFEVRHTAIR